MSLICSHLPLGDYCEHTDIQFSLYFSLSLDNAFTVVSFVRNPFSYPHEHAQEIPPSFGDRWLTPEDDPSATRGIPIFEPTMEEFRDFEGYMERVAPWGHKSGIIKVIPPAGW